jgi:sulfate adenylyltransferase, large subunit
MNIVIVGHVDHGKSTVIGRLLADTGSLPEGKLDQIKEMCRRNSKPFEYAFLLDALKDERSQGITIDTARCFFKTDKRHYIIIDAPGHIEFLKNMITGASRAEAALLVIDAHEGIKENSRRHGYLLAMLGIRQIAVLVNKLDLVDYNQEIYNNIVTEYSEFLRKINVTPGNFIPISAMEGDNIIAHSANTPWYTGNTILDELDSFHSAESEENQPFRMPVQDIYKFTNAGDDRRIIAGTVVSGNLKPGDEVVFYPSGKRTSVKSLEVFNRDIPEYLEPEMAAGFTVNEQIYIRRGELAVKSNEKPPEISTCFRASIFWLGKEPMVMNKVYHVKIGTAKVQAQLDKIVSVLDASSLDTSVKQQINRHDVAECIIRCEKPVAFDMNTSAGRFVVVDNYEISGGGIITESLTDELTDTRDLVIRRNFKWESSTITPSERAARLSQKASLILITGERSIGKKEVAKRLERMLFDDGRSVYFLGIGNVLYGVAAEIKTSGEVPERSEHIRRLGEVSNLLLDSGMILLVTATELTDHERDMLKITVDTDNIKTIWLGSNKTTDISCDMQIQDTSDIKATAGRIKEFLADNGIIFKI